MADCTLWVGGLNDERITEEILYELFLQSGPLEKVTIPKDKDGTRKKYAFVNFKHAESVPYSMQLYEGIRLYGQYLRLQTRQGQGPGPSSMGSTPPHNSLSPYNSPQYQNQDSRDMYPQQNTQRNRGFHRSVSGSSLDRSQDSFRSPRDQDMGSRSNDPPPRYQRSQTWHNGERQQSDGRDRYSRQSPQYNRSDSGPSPRHSPQYESRSSPQYGRESRSDSPHNYPSPQNEPPESIEARRQRIISQQNMSLTAHRTGVDHRSRRDQDRMQPYQRPHSTRRRY